MFISKSFSLSILKTEYLSPEAKKDRRRRAAKRTVVPFCPLTSLFGFVLPATDVAGGYSSSMLDAIRRAMMVSNILLINKVNEKSLTLKEVFRLATLGGSQGNDRSLSLMMCSVSVCVDWCAEYNVNTTDANVLCRDAWRYRGDQLSMTCILQKCHET